MHIDCLRTVIDSLGVDMLDQPFRDWLISLESLTFYGILQFEVEKSGCEICVQFDPSRWHSLHHSHIFCVLVVFSQVCCF